jgi:hypothetical protein
MTPSSSEIKDIVFGVWNSLFLIVFTICMCSSIEWFEGRLYRTESSEDLPQMRGIDPMDLRTPWNCHPHDGVLWATAGMHPCR